jgi:hypothetical protein
MSTNTKRDREQKKNDKKAIKQEKMAEVTEKRHGGQDSMKREESGTPPEQP